MVKKEDYRGCVYFFKHVGLDPIKIGYTSNKTPVNRFEQFRTYAPYGGELIGFIRTSEPLKIETMLHEKYKHKRLDGEWFDITVEEAEKEIKFNSLKEDVREMNEFQYDWCEHIDIYFTNEDYTDPLYFKNKILSSITIIEEIMNVDEYTINLKVFCGIVFKKRYNKNDKKVLNQALISIIGEPKAYRWSTSNVKKILTPRFLELNEIKQRVVDKIE